MPNKIGEYLYNNLPSMYKTRDIETDYTLQRYLNALGESMTTVEEEVRKILTLLDVEKMDSKYLPYYASMFGVTYSYDIPEDFQRKYLANLVNILKRKGTKSAIEFIAREITGLDTHIVEGHYKGFRTWGTNSHEEMLEGFTTPKTFSSSQDRTYYLMGDFSTDRTTVYVDIYSSEQEDLGEFNQKEKIIRKIVKDLIPSYVNLVFNLQNSNEEEEEVFLNVIETYVNDVDVHNGIKNTKTSEIEDTIKITTVDSYQVNTKVTELLFNNNIVGGVHNHQDYVTNYVTELGNDIVLQSRFEDDIDLNIFEDEDLIFNVNTLGDNVNITITSEVLNLCKEHGIIEVTSVNVDDQHTDIIIEGGQ